MVRTRAEAGPVPQDWGGRRAGGERAARAGRQAGADCGADVRAAGAGTEGGAGRTREEADWGATGF